jgi:hypothetical protein
VAHVALHENGGPQWPVRSCDSLPRRRFPAKFRRWRGRHHRISFPDAPAHLPKSWCEPRRRPKGPFYPDHLPLDTDNDLIVINDSITPAVGEITHLSGRILDSHGEPLRNMLVEIWQVDNNGAYLHSGTTNKDKRDKNFQGFGRFFTGSTGEYYFRTVKPVPYPGRTPHIHFMVKAKGHGEIHHAVLHQRRSPAMKKTASIAASDAKAARIGDDRFCAGEEVRESANWPPSSTSSWDGRRRLRNLGGIYAPWEANQCSGSAAVPLERTRWRGHQRNFLPRTQRS